MALIREDLGNNDGRRVRFAVVGLGHIAQIAVLPAFEHANELCELTGVISDDAEKIAAVSKKYNVENSWNYEQFDAALASGKFDAVYIALPNDMHRDYAVRAAAAGKHVLCEKPMALNEKECLQMIEAAQDADVKLMIAYRLHFEPANMEAVELIKSGKIGVPRFFNSSFTLQVRDGNIRTRAKNGGGPIMDVGIYCINAARYLFGEEPIEVSAMFTNGIDSRFEEIEETASVTMRFPNEKLATFVCSFGSKDVSHYEVVGTLGTVSLDPAYDYSVELASKVTIGDKTEDKKYKQHDQFAPELLHFADCILNDIQPRPNGMEGLNDMRIIDAIRQSVRTGQVVALQPMTPGSLPGQDLVVEKPKVKQPELTKVQSGTRD